MDPRRRTLFLTLIILVFSTALTAAEPQPEWNRIKSFVETEAARAKVVGMVAGYIDERGTNLVSYGRLSKSNPATPDANTVFEIGSISKAFTGVLLADMVHRGEVKLNDPATNYLPASVRLPERGAKVITLQHLATHMSGLARMPNNFRPRDINNPYADYSEAQLYAFLNQATLNRDIGAVYDYSNLGMGLLGHLLARRAGTNYSALTAQRIATPLGMNDTAVELSASMRDRLAPGHDASGKQVSNWDIPTLAGAGGLRSTMHDMLRFLAAQLWPERSPIKEASLRSQSTRTKLAEGPEMALGWHIMNQEGQEIIWHNGQTGGYHSFIGFDAKAKRGIVLLCNSAADIDGIGVRVLRGRLNPATTAKVDSEKLDRYVGRFQLAPNFVMEITKENERLFVQATGQGKLSLDAESETRFSVKGVEAAITFHTNQTGTVDRLTLHQNGDQVAKRVK